MGCGCLGHSLRTGIFFFNYLDGDHVCGARLWQRGEKCCNNEAVFQDSEQKQMVPKIDPECKNDLKHL